MTNANCSTFIYLVGGGRPSDPVKVGLAKDPVARLAGLQTASPIALRILATAEVPATQDARSAELSLHKLLKSMKLHVRGEWFSGECVNRLDATDFHFKKWTASESGEQAKKLRRKKNRASYSTGPSGARSHRVEKRSDKKARKMAEKGASRAGVFRSGKLAISDYSASKKPGKFVDLEPRPDPIIVR